VTGLLIDALTSKGPQFTVSGVGNVIAGGSITGTQLISTLASGTPPLQVSSTTVVPNLNASLLGGFAAGAFAPAGGSNAYIQNGTATQTGSNFNVDGNGTVGGILSGNAVISASSYKIGGSGVVLSVGTAADQNLFLGGGAGTNNTPGSGQGNMFSGYNAGLQNTSGNDNTFSGASAGLANTTGSHNTFVGMSSGLPVVTGSNNTFWDSTLVCPRDSLPVMTFISLTGGAPDIGVIRIGDPGNQNSAYIAGITGSSTNSGMPVFVDSTGKLGTSGGAVSFSQVVGTLASAQFGGPYNNSVALTNTTNSFTGTFAGNGAGLTGVTSGLSWPVVQKLTDYQILPTDFSTPTRYGNYIVLNGTTPHTFTLPNPAPPNGSCVAIGNVATGGGLNVFLTVSSNGLSVDGATTFPSQARRVAYLYCSDGSGYWRLNRNQAGVSDIGPALYTADGGPVNALGTGFVNGLNYGLIHGTMIYILPAHNNTSATPTLNVNGLGAKVIVKFGNQPLAPNDLTTAALADVIYDGQFWQLLNPQTNQGTVTGVVATAPLVSSGGTIPTISCPTCVTAPTLSGTTGSIGGSALSAGNCTTGTAIVTGATVGHPVSVSASDGTLPNGLIILSAAVTSSNTVTVQLCATGSVTPAANTYNVATQ